MLIPQEQANRSISLLAEVSRTVTAENNISKVLTLVLFIMSEHMDMLRGMITILNRDTGEIVIKESFGLSEEEKERGRYRIGEGIVGKVVQNREERYCNPTSMTSRSFSTGPAPGRAKPKEGSASSASPSGQARKSLAPSAPTGGWTARRK